ncbi:MAG: hypothetical protein WCP31_00985 [Chloroflexales bacterium]
MKRTSSMVRPFLLSLGLILTLFPGIRSGLAQGQPRCFNETHFCIEGRLLEFWDGNGGLAVFGYPTTPLRMETIEGRQFQVQWFERNRLELHPENQPPYDVLLGRLGADRLSQQGRDWQSFPKAAPQADCRFFPETGHNVCGRILEAWHTNGLELDGQFGKSEGENLALFGLPLSDLQPETIEGQQLQVQWFERARFELHPENSAPFDVLLGLLGNEVGPGGSSQPPVPGPPVPQPGITERIAFQSKRAGKDQIYLINPDGTGELQLTYSPESAANAAWSADATRIFYTSKERPADLWDLYVITADGQGRQRLTTDPSIDSWPSQAPNPTGAILFQSTRLDPVDRKNYEIFVMSDNGGNVTNLSNNTATDMASTWSPSGRIAFESNREGNQWDIFVMERDGSGQVNLTRHSNSDGKPAWSPDGTKLAFNSNRGGYRMDIYVLDLTKGTEPIQLTGRDGVNPWSDDKNPTWSPDGSKLALQSNRMGNYDIYIMNADGSGQTRLTDNPADDTEPAWSPIVGISGLPTPLPPTPESTAVQGPTGRIAFTASIDGNNEIFVMNANGMASVNVTNSPADDYDPTWSPDGSQLAFTSKRDGNLDIYVVNADGTNLRRLTTDPANDTNAAWSPDGGRILFNSERVSGNEVFSNADIYVMNADGSGQTNLTNSTSYEWRPAWSPDGSKIAFEAARDENHDIYVMNADGSGQIRLTNDPGYDEMPAWSPDGSRIVFQTDRDGAYEIYVMQADGSGQTNLSRDAAQDMHPTWSPDGQHIAFMSDRDGNEEIYVMNPDGNSQTNLTSSPTDERFPAWSR